MAQDPMLPRRYRVKRAWSELSDVSTMELEPIDGEAVPFAPGQFNMLYAFGVGEVAISISGDAADTDKLVHTIRNVGAISGALAGVSDGDVIGVRGPFGSAWPVAQETGRHIVFVAGGLGLAPLRPAIYHVLNNREQYSGMTLVYGARSPDDLLYADEIKAWKSRFDTEVEITVDHAAPGWTGQVGVVTVPLDRTLSGSNGAEVSAFVCGPEIMMRFSVMSLMAAGVPEDKVWISMERNMKCAIGFCGHCQFGGDFICRDGPVFRHDQVSRLIAKKEI
ncbi:FAD/NAD(P)-binding protein [Oricola nitratireducens]|uniref:FAD/NAD(P)-binding protein n=1 Tax=Oricola nitratireducens TaxID=2775868 RepID=UPI0018687BFE|nr:FAD/NAD(P)-binding protein [Oricola nitratireducens]